MEFIKVFKVEDTVNKKLNLEKLSLELKTSIISQPSTEFQIGQEIFIRYTEDITPEDIITLQGIIAAHDGEDAEAYNDHSVSVRENKIRELNQLAMYHPVLDNETTVRFLTHIDNYINAYIRSGIAVVVQGKIIEEATNPAGTYFDYLNEIVNTAGNKTYEYFLSKIN